MRKARLSQVTNLSMVAELTLSGLGSDMSLPAHNAHSKYIPLSLIGKKCTFIFSQVNFIYISSLASFLNFKYLFLPQQIVLNDKLYVIYIN